MLLTSFSKHSVLIPRGQSMSAVTGGVEYFREDRQHTCAISFPEVNGYFAGLRMTVAKCITLNNYVAVFKCGISVGLVSLVVYARCFVLEVAGSNPTPASFSFQLLFNFFYFFLKLFL